LQWCCACSEVEIDVLTGEISVLRTDIVYDNGDSLNPAVDIGQIEGAFVMGLGFMFTGARACMLASLPCLAQRSVHRFSCQLNWPAEHLIVGPDGRLITNGTWEYKPPSVSLLLLWCSAVHPPHCSATHTSCIECSQSKDIPIEFNVTLMDNCPNQSDGAVLSSKATGEPPYQLAASAFMAAKVRLFVVLQPVTLSPTFCYVCTCFRTPSMLPAAMPALRASSSCRPLPR
jgi:xanthine dehydrogenase/oxidase